MARNSFSPFLRSSYRQWFTATTLLAVSASTTLAVTLVLVDVTGDVATAGLVSGLILALELVMEPIGGGLADSVPRRSILRRSLVTALTANLALTVTLWWLSTHSTSSWNGIGWLLVASLAISAAATALAEPAIHASARSLITPSEFPRAMSAEQARSSTLQILGNPATGALYHLSALAPFVLRIVCDLGFLLTLRKIRQELGPTHEEERQGQSEAGRHRDWHRFVSGYRESFAFLSHHRALRQILVAAPLVNLMVFSGTSWTVLHLTAEGVGTTTIGLVTTGFALGGLTGSVVTPWLTDRIAPGFLVVVGLSWMTVCFAGLFLSEGRPWALFLAAAVGMFPSPPLNAGLFGHVFLETPVNMQGRVMSTFGLVGGLSSVLAPMVAGVAVQTHLDVALGAATCTVGAVGVVILASSRAVRGMEHPRESR